MRRRELVRGRSVCELTMASGAGQDVASLAAVITALASPTVGPLLAPMVGQMGATVTGAIAGALWALSREPTAGWRQSALLVVTLMLTSIVMTGAISWWLAEQYGLPPGHLPGLVAGAVAAVGRRWGTAGRLAWRAIVMRRLDGAGPSPDGPP